MKILVCCKQVPNTEAALSVDAEGTWIDEKGIGFELNEYDRYALEEALRIKDAREAEVVALTLGPDRAAAALKNCLAMGADRAIHLQDDAFTGGDPTTFARAIAAAAEKEGGFDLVLAGLQADDDNYSQTGTILAELLDLPHATAVMSLEISEDGSSVRASRELEGDRRFVTDLPLPALLTVQTGINEPRYASLKGIMAAKKKEVKTWSADDLELDPSQVGAAGALLEVKSLSIPPKGEGGEILEGSPDEVAGEIVKRIREKTGVL